MKSIPKASRPYFRLPFGHWDLTNGPSGLEYFGHPISGLIQKFGSPFYLFMEDRFRRTIHTARRTFEIQLPEGGLHYSVKTNGLQRVLVIVREEGLGAEVISEEEMARAADAGFTPDKLIFNGPGKTDAALRHAVRLGVHVNVESLSEALALCRIARQENRPVSAGIRISPVIFRTADSGDMWMTGESSVFGMDPGDPAFRRVLEAFSRTPQVRFNTLSAHIGTGIIDTAPYRLLVQDMNALRQRLALDDFRIEALDLGGGFSVKSEIRFPHRRFDDFDATEQGAVPAPDAVATFEDCCRVIAAELPAARPSIILEPGRLLVSDAFHLITRVVRMKKQHDTSWAVLDAGRIQNALFTARGYHDMFHVTNPLGNPKTEYTLVGPLCAGFDVHARGRRFPALHEGDALMICDVGAYNLSAQSAWSFPPAPVVAIAGRDVRRL